MKNHRLRRWVPFYAPEAQYTIVFVCHARLQSGIALSLMANHFFQKVCFELGKECCRFALFFALFVIAE
jgi:hypothetical protein